MKKKIFLVDDDEKLRGSLRSLLEEEFEIFEAEDGKEGLSIISKNQPDLVLSDIEMPVMDGITMSEKIQNFRPALKIIIWSGKIMRGEEAVRVWRLCDFFIAKPAKFEELAKAITKLLADNGEQKKE